MAHTGLASEVSLLHDNVMDFPSWRLLSAHHGGRRLAGSVHNT